MATLFKLQPITEYYIFPPSDRHVLLLGGIGNELSLSNLDNCLHDIVYILSRNIGGPFPFAELRYSGGPLDAVSVSILCRRLFVEILPKYSQ